MHGAGEPRNIGEETCRGKREEVGGMWVEMGRRCRSGLCMVIGGLTGLFAGGGQGFWWLSLLLS